MGLRGFALAVLALLSVYTTAASVEQGPSLQKCARDDPNANECLRQSIQDAIRSLKDGYAPLSMPPLDPLSITFLELVSPGGAKTTLSNWNVAGLQNVTCENVNLARTNINTRDRYDLTGMNTFQLSFSLLIPKFKAAGSYKMEKTFLGNKKPNHGSFTFNLTNYRVDYVLKATIVNEHATFTALSSSFNGGIDPEVQFSNLSVGRNRLWNDEPEEFLSVYKTAIDLVHPVLASSTANLLFLKVPFDTLFPPTNPRSNRVTWHLKVPLVATRNLHPSF